LAGVGDSRVVEALSKSLKDKTHEVRESAVRALQQTGRRNRRAIRALAEVAAKDRIDSVREYTASALGAIGRGNSMAVRALNDLLGDDETDVQTHAAKSLMTMKGDCREALAGLTRVVSASDNTVNTRLRIYAAQALGYMGRRARPALPSLEKMLDDKNSRIRLAAAWAISRIGGNMRKKAASILQGKKYQPELPKYPKR
jgi:HEAT repeat protein